MPKIVKTSFDINHQLVSDTIDYANYIYDDLTDNQLVLIDRFKKLEIYQQDLLMLKSQGYSLREIAVKLDVSYGWVYSRLKEINEIIHGIDE